MSFADGRKHDADHDAHDIFRFGTAIFYSSFPQIEKRSIVRNALILFTKKIGFYAATRNYSAALGRVAEAG